MTRDMLRRLARLEAERARNAAREADHGMAPEEYARAHAELTRLLGTHPTAWTPEEMEVMSGLFPHLDFRGSVARHLAQAEGA